MVERAEFVGGRRLPEGWRAFSTDDMADLADEIGVDIEGLGIDDTNARQIRKLILVALDPVPPGDGR